MKKLKEALHIERHAPGSKVSTNRRAAVKKLSVASMFKSLLHLGSGSLGSQPHDLPQQGGIAKEESRRDSSSRFYKCACLECPGCVGHERFRESLPPSLPESWRASSPGYLCGPSSHYAAAIQARAQGLITSSMTLSKAQGGESPESISREDDDESGLSSYCCNQREGTTGNWKADVDNVGRIRSCSLDSLVLVELNNPPELSPRG